MAAEANPTRIDARTGLARALRRATTEAEKRLWWHLKRLPTGSSHWRRQAPIGPYFADFACHERRVVIEVDGGQHGEAASATADALRTDYLATRGYRVLRFWNNDILNNIEGVLTVIAQALGDDRMPPTPDPSPPRAVRAGGGERRRRV
ncbi:endonuclease domain-containing protein [Rhodoplanes sp.]|uniref:endonuclease domain-containing protein n=1 Tax=Rhodoplanes sp. TaxID=1968906 RepID=UPI0025D68ED5|nr:endonuclease domain-containing protein [Rhodoplanes sp.]